jgi:hypothetical protein
MLSALPLSEINVPPFIVVLFCGRNATASEVLVLFINVPPFIVVL